MLGIAVVRLRWLDAGSRVKAEVSVKVICTAESKELLS
jgi:hypothetical protein